MTFSNNLATVGAALTLGAAGIAGQIDQATMIVLVVALVVVMPNARRCFTARR